MRFPLGSSIRSRRTVSQGLRWRYSLRSTFHARSSFSSIFSNRSGSSAGPFRPSLRHLSDKNTKNRRADQTARRPEERPPYFTVRQKFRNLSCVVLRSPPNDEREPLMKAHGISTLGPFFLSSAPDDSPSEAQRRRSRKPAGRSGERIRNERHRIFRRSDGADGDLPRTGIVSSESRSRKPPGGFACCRAGDRGFRSTIGGNCRIRSATPLKACKGGTALAAEGENPNPLLLAGQRIDVQPAASHRTAPPKMRQERYEYDIATRPGGRYTLLF